MFSYKLEPKFCFVILQAPLNVTLAFSCLHTFTDENTNGTYFYIILDGLMLYSLGSYIYLLTFSCLGHNFLFTQRN